MECDIYSAGGRQMRNALGNMLSSCVTLIESFTTSTIELIGGRPLSRIEMNGVIRTMTNSRANWMLDCRGILRL